MAHKRKILAVDDDPSICDFFESGLALEGYEVYSARSASQAQELIASKRPDLILMDIMMPEKDGITFTRELRSNPKTSHIPILIVSGLADAGTLNDALLFGAADYVVKPVEIDTLKAKIERILSAVGRRKAV